MALQIPQVAGSELMTAVALEPMMTAVWARLKHYAPWSLRLDYQHDIEISIDQDSSAVSLLPACLPDSHVIINGRLAMGGEYRVISLPGPLCSQL